MNLDDHAIQISEVMMQSLYKACDWQLDDINISFDDEDQFNAIHSELMRRVIAEMIKQI
jgi:hypothetical protein